MTISEMRRRSYRLARDLGNVQAATEALPPIASGSYGGTSTGTLWG